MKKLENCWAMYGCQKECGQWTWMPERMHKAGPGLDEDELWI